MIMDENFALAHLAETIAGTKDKRSNKVHGKVSN